MKIKKCIKKSFIVIGKEGSTKEGEGFIQKLWNNANSNFNEIIHLAKKDENGNVLGVWGAMSDFSHTFKPWENNFSEGLYLAGAECKDESEAPEGWTKWVIPAYEYLYTENENNDTFPYMIKYLKDNNILLVGAVHEFNCPRNRKSYLFFPIRRI